MKLYNYSVKVKYDSKTRYYTNNNSIPWDRMQSELKEVYKGIEEHNEIIEALTIKEVKI